MSIVREILYFTFFRLVNFRQKTIRVKDFCTDEFEQTSHVWWALIEEIAPRSEEMADEKEKACCVRGYHIYEGM